MKLALRKHLRESQVIPALPLALTPKRVWDPLRQRGLVRYYIAAGAGGLAVGVHSTQFEIRDPSHGLYRPVLELAAETVQEVIDRPFVLVAGLCGRTAQALREARTARSCKYHAGLLSLGAWKKDTETAILAHCRRVAEVIPVIGFYLQPAVGGRAFTYDFWRRFAEIPNVVAVKIAPFNRYQTIDVVRAVMASGREDVSLYTGNDDNIIADLMTPFAFEGNRRFIDGGLLGQWGVGTRQAVRLLEAIKKTRRRKSVDSRWMERNASLTDANAALFDPAHDFEGCLPGIHEVLRRQGLLSTTACLDPHETLSPGQSEEITRVMAAYPWLDDTAFIQRHLDQWLDSPA